MTRTRTRRSDFERLRGCPQCGREDFRRVAPLNPDVEVYQCENCHHRWSL